MQKIKEIQDPTSCWNKAMPTEQLFILLGRDQTAPATIRFWANERLRLGKNKISDLQIKEALQLAVLLEYLGDF